MNRGGSAAGEPDACAMLNIEPQPVRLTAGPTGVYSGPLSVTNRAGRPLLIRLQSPVTRQLEYRISPAVLHLGTLARADVTVQAHDPRPSASPESVSSSELRLRLVATPVPLEPAAGQPDTEALLTAWRHVPPEARTHFPLAVTLRARGDAAPDPVHLLPDFERPGLDSGVVLGAESQPEPGQLRRATPVRSDAAELQRLAHVCLGLQSDLEAVMATVHSLREELAVRLGPPPSQFGRHLTWLVPLLLAVVGLGFSLVGGYRSD